MDRIFELVNEADPESELKYDKFYVGLIKEGRANNYVTFRPQSGPVVCGRPHECKHFFGTIGHVIRCGRVSGLEVAAFQVPRACMEICRGVQFAYPRSMARRPE